MAFQPVTAACQCLINYRQAGQEMQSQLYFDTSGSNDPTVLTNLAQVVADWLTNEWAPLAASTATVISLILTNVDIAGGAQVTFTPIGGIQGGNASFAMPTGTTVTASWRTGLAGRSFRGRTYHVGLTESQVADNALTSTARSDLQQAYTQLIVDANIFGTPLSIASRVSNGVPRPAGILTPVQTCLVDEFIDSQRRRLTGRGR